MPRRRVAESRNRLVEPFAIMLFVESPQYLGLYLRWNLGHLVFWPRRRSLQSLTDILVGDHSEANGISEKALKELFSPLRATLGRGLEHHSPILHDDGSEIALKSPGIFEQRVAVVTMIHNVWMALYSVF